MLFVNKRKQLLSIFVDFIFLLSIFICIIGAIFFARSILFRSYIGGGHLVIKTEEIPYGLCDSVRKSDVLFDTLTKRKIGDIISLESISGEDGVSFIITTDAAYFPRGEALRTKDVWFRYSVIEGSAQ